MTNRPDPTAFSWERQPAHLQPVARPFAEMAAKLSTNLPVDSESDMALRKLLEARDCALRSAAQDHRRQEIERSFQAQEELDFADQRAPRPVSLPRRPNLEGG